MDLASKTIPYLLVSGIQQLKPRKSHTQTSVNIELENHEKKKKNRKSRNRGVRTSDLENLALNTRHHRHELDGRN